MICWEFARYLRVFAEWRLISNWWSASLISYFFIIAQCVKLSGKCSNLLSGATNQATNLVKSINLTMYTVPSR